MSVSILPITLTFDGSKPIAELTLKHNLIELKKVTSMIFIPTKSCNITCENQSAHSEPFHIIYKKQLKAVKVYSLDTTINIFCVNSSYKFIFYIKADSPMSIHTVLTGDPL